MDLEGIPFDKIAELSEEQLLALPPGKLEALVAAARAYIAEWWPTPKQALADKVSETAFETLYGGAAGGGKSAWILRHAWNLSIKYPGHKSLLLRRTFPELEESLILGSLEMYDQKLATYKVADKKWQFNNGSSIKFGHMEQEKDRFAYQSAAYELIAYDELTSFTEAQYDYLLSRCRTTKRRILKGVWPHMIAATNPGGVGGPWVKARFIDPAPMGTVFEGERGLKRAFIQAKLDDNPHIDDGYEARLSGMKDPIERRQLRDGDWEAFEGRFFNRWDREVHVIEPFEIPAWWPRERGLDHGYSAPFAVVWGAWGPDGELYIYRECYEREMTPSEQAKLVLTLSQDEKIGATFADPAIWSKGTGAGEPVSVQYWRNGLHTTRAMNARVSGWQAVHDRMRIKVDSDGVKHTGLYVFDTCPNFIRTVPMLPRDDNKPEDVDTHAEDHLADALRYLCMTHGRKGREPKPEGSEIERLLAAVDKRHHRDRRYHPHLGRL